MEPQRALCYIKAKYPNAAFEKTWLALFNAMVSYLPSPKTHASSSNPDSQHANAAQWIPPQTNITLPGPLKEALTATSLFTPSEVDTIMASAISQEWKDKLSGNTKEVLEQGAFGAPWMMVRNAEGKVEPFFGSDRFHFMWEYLGLPWQDVAVLPKGTKPGRAKL